jgi:hypothetical protein
MSLRKFTAALLTAMIMQSAPAAATETRIMRDFGPGDRIFKIDPSRLQRTILPAALVGQGCRFFEKSQARGANWQKSVEWKAASYADQDVYAQYVATVGPWWDNRISSVRCVHTAKVRCSVSLHRDEHRGGGELIVWGKQGIVDLAGYGWDNTVSSFMVFCNHMK